MRLSICFVVEFGFSTSLSYILGSLINFASISVKNLMQLNLVSGLWLTTFYRKFGKTDFRKSS